MDDEPALRAALAGWLEGEGWAVVEAADGTEALRQLNEKTALVVSDVEMPGMDGIELARRLAARRGAPPLLMLSGRRRAEVEAALPAGLRTRVLEKPFLGSALRAAVAELTGTAGSGLIR